MPIREFLIPIVLFLTVGGVLVLRPIAKHLGAALQAYAENRRSSLDREVDHMRTILESIETRLQLLEERQDFTDDLLTGGGAQPAGALENPRRSADRHRPTDDAQEATPVDEGQATPPSG